jgi:phage I-like protein
MNTHLATHNLAKLSAADTAAVGVLVYDCAITKAAETSAADVPVWVQIAPRGTVTARDGRQFTFVPEDLVAAFKGDGISIPVDFGHESESIAASPARGWIEELQARPGGLYARIDWLEDGRKALLSRQYRYVSPTFFHTHEKLATRIKSLALVTSPALAMPALAHSQKTLTQGIISMDKNLLAALSLQENASLEQALGEIARLKAAATSHIPDTSLYVPAAQYKAACDALSALKAEKAAAEEAAKIAACTQLVDDAVKAGKLIPATREHFLSLAKADFATAKQAIEAMSIILVSGADKSVAASAQAGALSPEEAEVAAKMGLSEEAFLKSRAA